MADERKVYDKVSWLCRQSDDTIESPWKGVYVHRREGLGRFYGGDDPVTEEFPHDRASVEADAADVYELESAAWVKYGMMHTDRVIESAREAERAMRNAMEARRTEELRRMTGTETKGN